MNIERITLTAGRTFNHPHERFANFRFDISLQIQLGPEDDSARVLKQFHAELELSAEQHKKRILEECERLYKIECLESILSDLRRPHEEWMRESPEERAHKLQVAEANLAELKNRQPYCDVDAMKEVHPGHIEHPETGNDREDDMP